jgi:hypothetical protein
MRDNHGQTNLGLNVKMSDSQITLYLPLLVYFVEGHTADKIRRLHSINIQSWGGGFEFVLDI